MPGRWGIVSRVAGFTALVILAAVAGYMFWVHESIYEECLVGGVRPTYFGLYLNYTCRLLNGSLVEMCSYPDAPLPRDASPPVPGYGVGLRSARAAADQFIRRVGLGALKPVSAGYMEAVRRGEGSLLDMYWVIVYGSNMTELRINVVVDAYGGAVAGYSIDADPTVDPRRLVAGINSSSLLLIRSGETGADVWLRVNRIIDAMGMSPSIYGEPRLRGTVAAGGVPRFTYTSGEPYFIEAQPWYRGRRVHGLQSVYIVIINNTVAGTAQPFFPLKKLMQGSVEKLSAAKAVELAENHLEKHGVSRKCIASVDADEAYAAVDNTITEAYAVEITYRSTTGETYYATIVVSGNGRVLGIEEAGSTEMKKIYG